MFQLVDGEVIILVSRGVYYQAPLAKREGTHNVYAKHGSGYVLIGHDGCCSKEKLRWEPVEGGTVKWPRKGRFERPVWEREECLN